MTEQGAPTRKEFEARLIARAWKDEAFAQELRTDPKAVIERELAEVRPEAKLPDNFEVRVVEESPTTMYLVLPPKPRSVDELSDADLDAAAAGLCDITGMDPVCC